MEHGATPLHCAAKGEHLEIVRFLLDRGAEINVRDKKGNTPLHRTAEDPHSSKVLEVIQLLLGRGAAINLGNNRGESAFFLAATSAWGRFSNKQVMAARVENNAQDRAFSVVFNDLCRSLEVVRVLLAAWMFGNRPGLDVGPNR
jgi:ankyrin repeat protein